jgi:SAM-dependent methyltransferase
LGDVAFSEYERISQSQRVFIESMLPGDWSWSGKRVLDFGCGVGRTLRQFAAEAEDAEFWGCDIHEPSVTWVREHLCPPFRVFRCEEEPRLPQADGYFDLIYAMSVYTHIVDRWAGWLLEHRRVLAGNGLLLVSFLGEGMIEPIAGEPWDERRIGMNVLGPGVSFDRGGPNVFHSPWWLRARWGRAFDIVELRAHGGDHERPAGHGLVLMRPKPTACSIAELERLEEHESREITALQHQVRQSMAESRALQIELDGRHRSPAITARRTLARVIRASSGAGRFLRSS